MKRLFIIVIIIAVILGVAITGAKITGLDKTIVCLFSEEKEEEPQKKKEEPEKATLINIKTITTTMFLDDNKLSNFVITLRLDVPHDKEKEVKKNLPRIQDAFVKELHIYLPKMLKYKKKIDLKTVKQILLRASHRTLCRNNINDVLIRAAYQQ
ncbi:MAG: hypothetical protein KAJ75_01370 [Alphaproteobacteria bacterium]|nr:hypothetical protein [Alphaproteobacteria bacterium]